MVKNSLRITHGGSRQDRRHGAPEGDKVMRMSAQSAKIEAGWRVGRRQEARFQWRRALSLGPEEDTAPKIEEKIDRGLGDSPEDT